MQKRALKVGVMSLVLMAVVPVPALAASDYTPTMKDMMSLNKTLRRYLTGLEKHDFKELASACAEDCVISTYEQGKLVGITHGRAALESGPRGAPPPNGGPGGPGGPGGSAEPPNMFHVISNDSWDFQSPTRVNHFAYWVSMYPSPDGGNSTLGHSGHYEDVFVKEKGEWLIKERKIFSSRTSSVPLAGQ